MALGGASLKQWMEKMIRLAILRSSHTSADAIPLLAKDSGAFDVLYLEDPSKGLPAELTKAGPEAILLDV